MCERKICQHTGWAAATKVDAFQRALVHLRIVLFAQWLRAVQYPENRIQSDRTPSLLRRSMRLNVHQYAYESLLCAMISLRSDGLPWTSPLNFRYAMFAAYHPLQPNQLNNSYIRRKSFSRLHNLCCRTSYHDALDQAHDDLDAAKIVASSQGTRITKSLSAIAITLIAWVVNMQQSLSRTKEIFARDYFDRTEIQFSREVHGLE